MANDDIIATFELVKHCRAAANDYLAQQKVFLLKPEVKKAIEIIAVSYKECYLHARNVLYKLFDEGGAVLISELKYADDVLIEKCNIKRADKFDSLIAFLRKDVITDAEPNCLFSHLSNHLMDMSTYREADVCDSSSMKEKLFISTVHKAKGLEFENVVVMRATPGRYPHFAHTEKKSIDEDKRLFYVAISRAMKKLIVSTDDTITPFLSSIINRFCVRFEMYRYMQTVVFAEITAESLHIRRERAGTRETYDFSPTSRIIYLFKCGDILGLRQFLLRYYAKAECIEILSAQFNGTDVQVGGWKSLQRPAGDRNTP